MILPLSPRAPPADSINASPSGLQPTPPSPGQIHGRNRGGLPGSVPHDEVIVAACPRAARAAAVPLEHLRGGPAVQLHQVTLRASAIQPGMAEVMPEPVRVQPQPGRLLMPGTDAEVAVDPAGGLMIDPDRPVLAALPADINLPAVQVHVAAARVIPVVADPGQLSQPDARRPEHRHDRRIAPLSERAAPARLLQPGKFYAGEKRHRPLPHRRRTQPGHGIGNLLLGRQPPEELPQRPVLLPRVGFAVAAQQPGDPPLDILGAYLAPPGLARLAKQVGGGEPQRRLGVDPDRPGRLVLRRQVQPERGDIRTERPRLQPPRTTPAPIQVCGSFTLVPRFRAPEAAGIAAS